jgi:Flp pilus assembly protein TadB
MEHIDIFGFLGLGAIALFSFLAVAKWSDSRRGEREAYYKSETLRKIMEMPGATPASVQEYVRLNQANDDRRRREGLKLGGLITVAVGFGLMIFLGAAPGPAPIHVLGMIPVFVGLALLIYAWFLGPKVS